MPGPSRPAAPGAATCRATGGVPWSAGSWCPSRRPRPARTAPAVTTMALWMLSRLVVLQNTARRASPWSGVSPEREAMLPSTCSRAQTKSPSPTRHHPTASTARRRSGDRRTAARKQARATMANGPASHPHSEAVRARACRWGCSGRCRPPPVPPPRAPRRATSAASSGGCPSPSVPHRGPRPSRCDCRPREISAWSSRTPGVEHAPEGIGADDKGHHLLHDRSIRHGQLGRGVLRAP